jgi:hypothetical protein
VWESHKSNESVETPVMCKKVFFLGDGSSQGHLSGLLGPISQIQHRTIHRGKKTLKKSPENSDFSNLFSFSVNINGVM